MPTRDAQFGKLFGYLGGFQGTWVAAVGRKAGLFQAVQEAAPGITADALAKRLEYEPRYVRVWCRAAYAYELLDYDPHVGFRLAPHVGDLLLNPADPQYLGGRVEISVAFTEDFAAFPARLRDGAAFPRKDHSPELIRGIMETTKPDFAIMAEIVLPQAPAVIRRLDEGGAILDVGCGAAYGLIHLSRRFPRAHGLGLEVDPPMLALAAQNLAEAGVGDRVRVEPTSALAMEFVDRFDLVVMNIALHETGERPEWEAVLARVRRALRPGGALLISELPYPGTIEEYRAHPAYRMLAGIQHHEVLVGCGMITVPELQELLEGTGFRTVRRVEQPNPTRVMYLAGT
ncbi:MAG TPA: class I SAM-dependent methyltransferase [Methylomirabilota bacterium]|nr:class I SAM-dependent methyltransferase [Methylomirabilota bacterium]